MSLDNSLGEFMLEIRKCIEGLQITTERDDSKDHRLAEDIKISSLDNLLEYINGNDNKLILHRSQLDDELIKFLDCDPYEEECEDTSTIKNGQIKLIVNDGGPGGSSIITSALKHNDIIVALYYCTFGGTIIDDCYDTEIMFNIDNT